MYDAKKKQYDLLVDKNKKLQKKNNELIAQNKQKDENLSSAKANIEKANEQLHKVESDINEYNEMKQKFEALPEMDPEEKGRLQAQLAKIKEEIAEENYKAGKTLTCCGLLPYIFIVIMIVVAIVGWTIALK